MKLSPQDVHAIRKELCSRKLAEFAKMAWHVLEPTAELKWGWALDAMSEHLEAVSNGEITKLLINVPPGCMKSLLTGVIWPAWEWGPKAMPGTRFIGTSYKERLAVRDNMKFSRLIKSGWYQQYWPVELTLDQSGKLENDATGFREAMAFKSTTGSRGDRVLLDDPLSADEANSDADRRKAEITFTEALPTRINNDHSAIVVIMQRLHQQDTSGIILDRELGYEHLMLPMEYEPDRACTTGIGFTDPRTEQDELLFPERFPREQVDDLKRTLGSYASAGQLQQRPAPRGGGIFRDEWWEVVTHTPVLAYMNIYADTAQKTKEHNDWSVFECWGATRHGNRPILLDVLRGKWEAPELLKMARAFWAKHKQLAADHNTTLRFMKVEDKVSGTGLIQTLKRENIPVLPIQRNRDKIIRAYDVAPIAESGQCMLLGDTPWLSDFLSEVSVFPNGAHDDQVDPMMDAITDIAYKRNSEPQIRAL